MTETLEQRITRHEGQLLKPYKDTMGKLTIGIGRCLDTKGISADEAQYLLKNDITQARAQLLDQLPWTANLDDLRQEVLIEMVFQLGINGVLAFKNTLAHVQAGEWDSAANGMLESEWQRQTPVRCQELSEIMRTGNV